MTPALAEKTPTKPREHPWERARRLSFARWEEAVRRTPYGRPLPDVVGFANGIEPPVNWSEAAEASRLFALSALPTGLSSTYLAAVPAGRRRPAGGSLVRLAHPVKRVLPASEAVYGELLIEAREAAAPASWEDILEGAPSRVASNPVPQLSGLWRLPPAAIEELLLPLVGSLPWHGRPAGLNAYVEFEGWPLARLRSFLSSLVALVPEWVSRSGRTARTDARVLELVSGARLRRLFPSSARPFSVQLRSVSAPPARPPGDGPPRSIITYGSALASEFEAMLFSGQSILLLPSEDTVRIPRKELEVPDAVQAAVWGLHWWAPEPPDAPDWHRWLQDEEPRLQEAREAIQPYAPKGSGERRSHLTDQRAFRDQLAQAAIGRARLRGAPEVEQADLGRTVDSLLVAVQRAAAWAREGHGPWARVLDRTEGGRTSRLRRTLEGILGERNDGLTVNDAVGALRERDSIASARDVENQLERLRIHGVLFQDRTGRYRLA
jgi:hypothetical protein